MARRALDDADEAVRATAVGALDRMRRLGVADLAAALRDPSPKVRRRAAEIAARYPEVDLVPVLEDHDPLVAEAAAYALGERSATDAAVAALAKTATDHGDALVREAAVAALGALGDDRGLDAILHATIDKPAVRRRAVIALAPFEGPAVDEALQRALTDRDWQVRQAAEDLLAE